MADQARLSAGSGAIAAREAERSRLLRRSRARGAADSSAECDPSPRRNRCRAVSTTGRPRSARGRARHASQTSCELFVRDEVEQVVQLLERLALRARLLAQVVAKLERAPPRRLTPIYERLDRDERLLDRDWG